VGGKINDYAAGVEGQYQEPFTVPTNSVFITFA
jgi:hypothetical protein